MAIMTAMVMYILKQVSTVHRDNEHARPCILCQHRRPFCGCHCGLDSCALDLSIAGVVSHEKVAGSNPGLGWHKIHGCKLSLSPCILDTCQKI